MLDFTGLNPEENYSQLLIKHHARVSYRPLGLCWVMNREHTICTQGHKPNHFETLAKTAITKTQTKATLMWFPEVLKARQ